MSSFEPVLGQSYTQGQVLGKIDVMKGYKLVADVDEFYLSKIKKDQQGSIDFNGKKIQVIVDKVIPEIVNGRFKVELQLPEQENLDLRQGLSFGVRLVLSGKTKTTVLPKGSFYNETSGKWIFVVTGENKAERRTIKLGKENPLYYEVLEGLKPGDKVITSGYQDYKEIEVLNLEK
ncbi:efflux RND transporter periplasmic adaptor subunit [Flavobacterium sediminis]|uniref:efflux RND transporter periplasmic adaptor subunit n=1 Tax=Flavobacterium sediminis TaxID=2201181 RepID=UPI0026864725|nr:HlyD family efflux transporter periplasmic adaptor subunit [Flavobacterium sediminis]